jgi:hypothetical protein
MTHAEFRSKYPGPGLEPSDCPGELAGPSVFDQPPGEPEIHVYRCTLCGRGMSLHTGRNVCLNEYEDPRPALRAMLEGLADRLRAPR